jgi:hypothetical protein
MDEDESRGTTTLALKGIRLNRNLLQAAFFGNHFYGICAVGLAIEAGLQQRIGIADPLFYLFIYLVTVFFYTLAYMNSTEVADANPRTRWYVAHKRRIKTRQLVFLFLIASLFVYFLVHRLPLLSHVTSLLVVNIGMYPLAAGLYYGIEFSYFGTLNLRKIGWLKPFIIGFAWAGLVTIYPLIYESLIEGNAFVLSELTIRLFVKNLMFIALLSIMFDIKDYSVDHNQNVKTLVVKLGLRRTIFYLLIPLCVLGLAFFVQYGIANDFSTMKLALNILPFLLLLVVAYGMQHRRTIFFYLVVIDGLMLVKAVCGSVAMIFF